MSPLREYVQDQLCPVYHTDGGGVFKVALLSRRNVLPNYDQGCAFFLNSLIEFLGLAMTDEIRGVGLESTLVELAYNTGSRAGRQLAKFLNGPLRFLTIRLFHKQQHSAVDSVNIVESVSLAFPFFAVRGFTST